MIDVSISYCSMNWGSLDHTRLAQTRQMTKNLSFPDLHLCWCVENPAEAPGAVEFFFAFCYLLLTFYSVLHQCFPLLLCQYEWWRCLKYLQLLQGRGHRRGTFRNQNESPHSNVSDCCGSMQCCQRKFTIALVLLDEDSWLWLEPVVCEQRGKGNFCRVR